MSYPGEGWRCSAPITVDNTLVIDDLVNFQVYLSEDCLPEEMLDADGILPAKSAGGDVRFSSDVAGATPLKFDLVEFQTNNNPALGSANIWVNIPSLLGGSDTTFYVWWANSDASALPVDDTYGQYETWKAGNACAVRYMLDDDQDRAENNVDLSDTDVAYIAGVVDDCIQFDAEATEAAYGDLPAGLRSKSQHDWSGWIYVANTTAVGEVLFIYGYDWSVPTWCYRIEVVEWNAGPETYRLQFIASFSTQNGIWREDTLLDAGTWYRMGISYDGSNVANNPTWALAAGGPAITELQAPIGTFVNGGDQLYMGRDNTGPGNHLHGRLDEIAVRNVVLAQVPLEDRTGTENNNETNPAAFASAGDRQFIPRSIIRV